jgi:hypothetical protein
MQEPMPVDVLAKKFDSGKLRGNKCGFVEIIHFYITLSLKKRQSLLDVDQSTSIDAHSHCKVST